MASQSPIELELGSATLLAVPAIHFQANFALQVNRACADPQRRPDAIAVEVGPVAAAAVRQWLGELGIGPTQRTRLPCMLGLVKRNRFLKPSMRRRALDLQRATKKELDSLPPGWLYDELGFAASSVLILSPTDSIVEAMRCACELGIPLYGVDLEDSADPAYPKLVFPDPAATGQVRLENLYELAAGAPHDAEVDPRREMAMAARLKGLLQRHQRVLFTGGMAHWKRVARLIKDDSLRPSLKHLDGSVGDAQIFSRTVIHPALAVGHMDAFPAVASAFERRRRHPGLDALGARRPIPRHALLRALLRKSYRRYFAGKSKPGLAKQGDWSGRIAFEQLLCGQALLNMRALPSLSLLDRCARATLSDQLRTVLRHTFTEFPWVQNGTLARCHHLRPTRAGEGGSGQVVLEGESLDPCHVTVFPGGSHGTLGSSVPQAWRNEMALAQELSGFHFTWRPWEHLLNAMCAVAISKSLWQRRIPNSEPYAGQLLDGIDLKATLRTHSRGQEEIWVRDARRRRDQAPPELPEGFPVVWIFREATAALSDHSWGRFFDLVEWLMNFTEDPATLRRLRAKPGSDVVDLVTYATSVPVGAGLDRAGIKHNELAGLLAFSPVFESYRQAARWLQITQAARNPIGFRHCDGSEEQLLRNMAAQANPSFRELPWPQLLIALAIPYARASLTVVAPKGFAVAPSLQREAARRGTRIALLADSNLPAHHLRRLAHLHTVPGRIDRQGRTVYVREAERLLGEQVDRHRELLPPAWRQFGLER